MGNRHSGGGATHWWGIQLLVGESSRGLNTLWELSGGEATLWCWEDRHGRGCNILLGGQHSGVETKHFGVGGIVTVGVSNTLVGETSHKEARHYRKVVYILRIIGLLISLLNKCPEIWSRFWTNLKI